MNVVLSCLVRVSDKYVKVTRKSPYTLDTATQSRIKVVVRTIRDAAYHQERCGVVELQDKPSPTACRGHGHRRANFSPPNLFLT